MGYFIPVSILSLQKGVVNGENFKRIEFSLFIIKIRSHYVLSRCVSGDTLGQLQYSQNIAMVILIVCCLPHVFISYHLI